jgi:hypothetical protein
MLAGSAARADGDSINIDDCLSIFESQTLIANPDFQIVHSLAMTTGPKARRDGNDALSYFLAALCGVGTGIADVAVDDLLFTALLVLSACMLLGLLSPRWPWRWVVVTVMFVPFTEFAAYLIVTVKPTRAQVCGSFLTALPGIAGAYGGAVMRHVIDNLRAGK